MPSDRSKPHSMAFAKITVSEQADSLGQALSAHALTSHLPEPYAPTYVGIHG